MSAGLAVAAAIGLLLLAHRLRRGDHRRAAALALALGGLATGLGAAEAVLLATESTWKLRPKLSDHCYPDADARGYLKPSAAPGNDGETAWCAGPLDAVWRSCEQPTPGEPRKATVLALGDSFTDGVGVFAADAWPAQLERLLSDRDVGVVNCGRAGSSTVSVAKRYLAVHDKHRPDLVVYALVLNDVPPPDESRWPTLIEEHLLATRSDQVDHPTAIGRFVAQRLRQLATSRDTVAAVQAAWADRERAEVQQAYEMIGAMRDLVRDNGGRLVVAIWPLLHRLEAYPFRAAHQAIRAEVDALGVPVVDLLEPFEGLDETTLHAHRFDHHPNELAHALAARHLAVRLRPLLD